MAKGKITISTWEKMVNDEPKKSQGVINGEEVEVTISPTISFEDAADIVNTVVGVVIDTDTGEYHPEVREPLFRAKVLEKYAGFTLPKSFDKIYKLVYSTDAYEWVEAWANMEQLLGIESAIYDGIDYEKNVIQSGVQAEMQKTLATFDEFRQRMEEMFAGVDEEQIGGMVRNIATMTEPLDADNLVRAVREAQNGEA